MRGSLLPVTALLLVLPCSSFTSARDVKHERRTALLSPSKPTAVSHTPCKRSGWVRRRGAGAHEGGSSSSSSSSSSSATTTSTTTSAAAAAVAAIRSLRGGSAEAAATAVAAGAAAITTTTASTTTTTITAAADTASTPTTQQQQQQQASGSLKHTARILGYFGLWYALNIWYNIVNKKVLNALPLPSSIAVIQLGIGSLWVAAQWLTGLRARPGKLTSAGVSRLTPVAFFHGGGQMATVLSLGAGSVSFTHVVKAMEPFFSAVVAGVWFRQVFRWQVYAALLPVVAGVSLACAKEINFSWVSFLAAMASNLLFACRANFSKALMIRPPVRDGASISSANLYGLVTLTAFMLFAPVTLLTDWGEWGPAWALAMKNGHRGKTLALSVLLSGISHYLNNEVMYLALGSVHPTTLAVGNTMKRVFIVVTSLIVFKTQISRLGVLGSAIAVGGVLVYSLTKQHYDVLDRKMKD